MKTILVATDFNELASAALRFASVLARRAAAEIVVVYADTFEPPPEFTSAQIESVAQSIERSRRRAKDELDRHAARNIVAGVHWRSIVVEGTPAAAILRVAEAEHADLIAMGTHGRGGLQRLLMGSVAERVIREAHLPVLTVRTTEIPKDIRRIACPTGGTDNADYGQSLASALGSDLICDGDGDYDLIIASGDAAARVRRHASTPVITLNAEVPHVV
ncbi:MAG TPA: universal stress protein [Thermoanaerobaculia bacterium]|nr:universal stress protein [Thermoanaerobaculia bacterium]